MALTQDERDIVTELKNEGYSLGEVQGFLASNRAQVPSRVSNKLTSAERPGLFADAGEDLVTGAKELFGDYKRLGEGVVDSVQAGAKGEQSLLETGYQTAASVGGGVGSIIGRGVQTLGRLFMREDTEKTIGQGVQQGVAATGLPTAIEKLSPRAKRNVDATLNLTELAGVKGGTSIGSGLAKSGFRNLDDAARTFRSSGIKEVGEKGINQAFDLGVNPESLMQRVARISKGKQAKFEDLAQESVGSYLVSRNIFGSPDHIADQLVTRMSTYKNRVDRNLAQVDGVYKAPQIKTALDELIDIDDAVSSLGAPGRDSGRIKELLKKHQTTGLSLSEVNEVKRLYERNVRVNYLNPASPKPEKLMRSNNIDSALRKYVEDKAAAGGFTNVRQLNKETQLARQLADDLGAEFAGKQGNNAISLTDWILLAEVANSPTAAAGFIGKKAFGSERVMSATARALSRNKGVKADIPAQRTEPQVNGYLEFLKKNNNVEDAAENVTRAAALSEAEMKAFSEIDAQFRDIPETGTSATSDGGMIRTTSFPSFVPSDLRSKARFDRVLNHLENGTKPRANAGKDLELYDLVRGELKQRAAKSTGDAAPAGVIDNDAAFGVIAGIQTDEDGNITVNPFASALGVAGATVAKKVSDIKVKPDAVAQRIDDIDLDKISRYLDDPDDFTAKMEVEPLLQAVGIPKNAPQSLKERFLKDVTDEYAFIQRSK